MQAGVTMVDPARTYIDATVELARRRPPPARARSSRAAPSIGAGSVIGPDTQLVDTIVGRDAVIRQTVAFDTEIGDGVDRRPVRVAAPGHAGRAPTRTSARSSR